MASKLYSIFSFKCPTCHQGDLFPTGSFSFKAPFKQYEHCPACGQSYFPEPGFYYGAMFISYIGSGFFCLGFVMLLHWVLGWSTALSFVALLAVVALFFVWWFRFSRENSGFGARRRSGHLTSRHERSRQPLRRPEWPR